MDISTLMSQARAMQEKVSAAQEKLAGISVKGIAGGGLAVADMDGKYNLKSLSLAPELMKESPDDAAAVIVSAIGDAKAKADAIIDREMNDATAGMQLPV